LADPVDDAVTNDPSDTPSAARTSGAQQLVVDVRAVGNAVSKVVQAVARPNRRGRPKAMTVVEMRATWTASASSSSPPRAERRPIPTGTPISSPTHPATVELGHERFQVRATIPKGQERERLFNQMAAQMPFYAEFQRETTRQIPVIVLERIDYRLKSRALRFPCARCERQGQGRVPICARMRTYRWTFVGMIWRDFTHAGTCKDVTCLARLPGVHRANR
jgi:hypothetical protein